MQWNDDLNECRCTRDLTGWSEWSQTYVRTRWRRHCRLRWAHSWRSLAHWVLPVSHAQLRLYTKLATMRPPHVRACCNCLVSTFIARTNEARKTRLTDALSSNVAFFVNFLRLAERKQNHNAMFYSSSEADEKAQRLDTRCWRTRTQPCSLPVRTWRIERLRLRAESSPLARYRRHVASETLCRLSVKSRLYARR